MEVPIHLRNTEVKRKRHLMLESNPIFFKIVFNLLLEIGGIKQDAM